MTNVFFGGFTVDFIKGWKLTLVMLSTIPLFIAAGGDMAMLISKKSIQGQQAYAEAGNVVEKKIGAIRTVSIHQQSNAYLVI